MSVAVREARPSDLAVALGLWRALQAEHEALDGRYRLADDADARWSASYREWTRSPASRVWLAVGAGHAVGLATAHLYAPAPTFRPVPLVHVDDLYVAPAARGSGVGRRLLDAARAWGRAEGAQHLQAGVLTANAGARAFWTREGGADYAVTVTLPLADGEDGGERSEE